MSHLIQKWLLEFLAQVAHSKSFLNRISEDSVKAGEQRVTIESYEIPISQQGV